MGSTRGHPVLGALSGLVLGIALALDLLLMGVLRIDSAVVGLLPIVCLVAGALAGFFAPLRIRRG